MDFPALADFREVAAQIWIFLGTLNPPVSNLITYALERANFWVPGFFLFVLQSKQAELNVPTQSSVHNLC